MSGEGEEKSKAGMDSWQTVGLAVTLKSEITTHTKRNPRKDIGGILVEMKRKHEEESPGKK